MRYKSENWKDKLNEVRAFTQKDEVKEDVSKVDEEIELLLQELDEETPEITEGRSLSLDQIKKKYKRDLAKLNGQFPKDRSPLNRALLRHAYDHGLIKTDDPDHADKVIDGLLDDMDESVVREEKVSVEKTVEKLTEKNMLGRLAKQLRLTEEGKNLMFNYFEKGELNQ